MDAIPQITESKKFDLKDAFQFFKRETEKLPKSSKTPLGEFLAKSKEEKPENYSKHELINLIDNQIRDFIIVDLENEIFESFLTKNSPRFNPDEFQEDETPMDKPSKSIKIFSKDLESRKDIMDDLSETDTSKTKNSDVINYKFYIKSIEQEIKEMHNSYQKDVEKHEKKLNTILAEKKAHEIHLEKIVKVKETFDTLIVRSRDRKITVNPFHFAEFLKLSKKQDKEDARRLNVMLYEVKNHCKLLEKMYEDKSRTKVDLEIKAIESAKIKENLSEKTIEFLQLKNLIDKYNLRIESQSKIIEEKNKMLENMKKDLLAIKNSIEQHKRRKSIFEPPEFLRKLLDFSSIPLLKSFILRLKKALKNETEKYAKEKNKVLNNSDFWEIGEPLPDYLVYAAGKLSCLRTRRQIDVYHKIFNFQENEIQRLRDEV